jgi:hypothetical protein
MLYSFVEVGFSRARKHQPDCVVLGDPVWMQGLRGSMRGCNNNQGSHQAPSAQRRA